MTPSFLSFLLFLGSLGLLVWKPEAPEGHGVRMLAWGVLGFVSIIDLLFSLFTVWWPPAHMGSVVWSAAAVAVLAWIAISNARPTDWLQ